MNSKKANQGSDPLRGIKKFFLSAFVILTFIAYYFHERNTNPANSNTSNTSANAGGIPAASDPNTGTTSTVNNTNTNAVPPAAAASLGGLYKNGTFTGPSVNVYYGNVQVQVVVQNGKITNIQFLDYPHDRRTSQRINDQVMPWLTQEAIQAQSANVDLISGATLTSEGFANSLQAALLSAAKN
jgi:uncharacterized protein with FMN-binding domain